MFMVSAADAAAIRAAHEQGGDRLAAAEVRRRFAAVTDDRAARDFARTIAGWQALPVTSGPGRQPPLRPPRGSARTTAS